MIFFLLATVKTIYLQFLTTIILFIWVLTAQIVYSDNVIERY